MLTSYYIRQITRAVSASLVITIGYMNFGNPDVFDRLFLFILVTCSLLKNIRSNVNVIGILLIFIFERFSEEILYFSMFSDYQKILVYGSSFIIVFTLYYDSLIKYLVIPTVTLACIVELYWFFTGYKFVVLQFYIALLLLNVVVRHLLFMRVPITETLFQKGATPMNIDYLLYSVAKWCSVITAAMVIEYVIRHCTIYNPLYVYNFYPYALHTLSVITLILIFDHIVNSRLTINI